MNWWLLYLTIGCLAALVTALVTPLCRLISWKIDLLDKPLGEGHKKHTNATPLLGGMAMLAGWLLTLGGGLLIASLFREQLPESFRSVLSGITDVRQLLIVIIGGAGSLAVMGLIDDKLALGPGIKLLLQIIICGAVAAFDNVRITLFWDIPVVTWLITVGWFLFIINSFNFLDNMDGLASGLATIAALIFSGIAGIRGQYFVAALGMATAGSALGFYWHNKSPASIFMGDSGSHFLGFLLAVLGSLTLFYKEGETSIAALLIPVFILALPIFDTFAVMVIRLREKRPIYKGDHSHISHRFLKMGCSRKTAVNLVHLLAIAIGLTAFPLLWLGTGGVILVLLQAGAMLALVSILHAIDQQEIVDNHPPAEQNQQPKDS